MVWIPSGYRVSLDNPRSVTKWVFSMPTTPLPGKISLGSTARVIPCFQPCVLALGKKGDFVQFQPDAVTHEPDPRLPTPMK